MKSHSTIGEHGFHQTEFTDLRSQAPLTLAEYEKYKKRLADAAKERSILEAKRAQLVEHLRLTYDLTPDQAKQEVVKLKEELPKLEEELETKYKEFNDKWQSLMQ